MGLDIDFNGTTIWHSSYTTFGRFRATVADWLQVPEFRRMMCHGEEALRATSDRKLNALEGEYPFVRPFFGHSDYEGSWSFQDCALIYAFFKQHPEAFPREISESRKKEFLQGLFDVYRTGEEAIFC